MISIDQGYLKRIQMIKKIRHFKFISYQVTINHRKQKKHKKDKIELNKLSDATRPLLEEQDNWWCSLHWKQYPCLDCISSHLLLPRT